LVAEVRRCGLPVRVDRCGTARNLPAEVDLVALRVVQESLTNVLRHADPAETVVQLSFEPAHLRVVVSDDGGGGVAADGQGLAGLRERVEALGGRFTAGPHGGHGWRVEAVLPAGAAP
jgi:signal transduction histidine kinase